MFGKKKIIIGETYIYDALNETNMAVMTTLVTVIKKVKRNTYAVVSVNNGNVFNTHAKYLTPYVNPETAAVIRCHYGTTEFDESDIEYFDVVDLFIDSLVKALKDSNIPIPESTELLKELTDIERDKIMQYVGISKYKQCVSLLCNAYNKFKNIPDIKNGVYSEVEAENIFGKKFKESFDIVVRDYLDGKIDETKFIDYAIDVIEMTLSDNSLINKSNIPINRDDAATFCTNMINNVCNQNVIAFAIIKDELDDKFMIEVFADNGDKDVISNSAQRFIKKAYPRLDECYEYIPKYRVNIINVPRRIGDYNG